MEWADSEVELMVREILEDEFDRPDIEVRAHGRLGNHERCVWLCSGKERVPVIPLRFEYTHIDRKHPPRLSASLEEWRNSHTGDLPRMISRALTHLQELSKK